MSFLEFLSDLFNPSLAFLPKALLVAVLSAVVCGAVGVHVVLRGLSFIGDALSHSIFPGIAIAFALQGSLVIGGLVAGLAVALLITVFSRNRRLREDSVIGVFFVAAFALGMVIVSLTPGYTGSIESLLFGSLTGVSDSHVVTTLITALGVSMVLAIAHSRFVAVSLDREYARSIGVRVGLNEVLLYALIAVAVVISVQTIGNILVLALLVTPAATARLVTDRVLPMLFISPLLGALAAFFGIWASWVWDVPTGPAIVLCSTAVFVGIWALTGLIRRNR